MARECKKDQLMAVLEIPELEMQIQQDAAAIASAAERVTHAQHELDRTEAQHQVVHLQADASERRRGDAPRLGGATGD